MKKMISRVLSKSMTTMTTPILNLPKRVLLRGFEKDQQAETINWLRSHGVESVNLTSLAEWIVVGPEACPDLVRKSQVNGLRVMGWEGFRAAILASHAGAEDAGGGDLLAGLAETSARIGAVLETPPRVPIETGEGTLRVLDLELPLASCPPQHRWRVPDASQFVHLCLDKPFLETLRAVALGVLHRMPVALQGETASSKTSAVLYLANLLGQPVVRLNLNGHTDAGELVGRYVPCDSENLLEWDSISHSTPWLSSSSKRILSDAKAAGRSLDELERLAILGREKLPIRSWRFQEGYLPQAMRHGWWVLLDEVNLAETQVLERLNSALENPPTLVLSEGAGTVFGPGGDVPVHSEFRILCTMNPPDYCGRATLSRAFSDRWGVWSQVSSPGERELEQMLRRLVFGEHPRVSLFGVSYRSPGVAPVYPELQAVADMDGLLQRIAMFHHGICRAAGAGGTTPSIGRLSRERYSFSRRVLLNLMHTVSERIRSGCAAEAALFSEAIQMLYVARIREEADRRAVCNILRAGGLL